MSGYVTRYAAAAMSAGKADADLSPMKPAATSGRSTESTLTGSWQPPEHGRVHPLLSSVKMTLSRIGQSFLSGAGVISQHGKERRLRVKETVSLGDKRFVSLIEVDGRSLLIGGGAGSVSLLSALPPSESTFEKQFDDVSRDSGAE